MIIAAWFLADFLSGFFHWFEDKCLDGNSRFSFIRQVAEDNERHHTTPTALCGSSIWGNIDTSAVIAWPVCAILWALDVSPVIYMAVFFASFANLIHMWSHEKRWRVPKPVRWLQHIGIFCSQIHHAGHHYSRGKIIEKKDASIRYCVMTDWLNPVLDYINFFGTLELIFGIKKGT